MAHPDDEEPRPDGWAWAHALGWGLLAFAVLAPVAVLVDDQHTTGSLITRIAVTTAAIAAICGVLAFMSAARWSWWLYPPIVVLPAVAIVALTDLAPDRLGTTNPAADQHDRSLLAPEQAGSWKRQSSSAIDARAGDLREQVARADEGLVTVYGEYRRPGGDLLIYNGLNAGKESVMVEELIGDPESALRDYMEQTGIDDVDFLAPGDLGGALACGTVPQMGPYVDLPVCGWADSAGIGRVTYRVDGINADTAAGLTRDFRGEVTQVG
ncbi:hypothetical protein BH11ACT8_BH11ACT8_15600 [soil metagenome]